MKANQTRVWQGHYHCLDEIANNENQVEYIISMKTNIKKRNQVKSLSWYKWKPTQKRIFQGDHYCPNTQVELYSCSGAAWQKWDLVGGTIVNRKTGRCLDIQWVWSITPTQYLIKSKRAFESISETKCFYASVQELPRWLWSRNKCVDVWLLWRSKPAVGFFLSDLTVKYCFCNQY